LINAHRTFAAGVKNSMNEQDFDPNDLKNYKEKYKAYIVHLSKDEKKQAEKVMDELSVKEKSVTWENILKVRKEVIKNYKIEVKQKMIEKYEAKKSKKRLFNSEKIRLKYEKKLVELKKELAQLQGIGINAKTDDKITDMKEQLNVRINFNHPELTICNGNEKILYNISFKTIQMSLKVKGNKPEILLSYKQLIIQDRSLQSHLFPDLLTIESFKLEASLLTMKLELSLKKTFIYVLSPTITEFITIVKNDIKANSLDLSSESIFGTNLEYITSGLNYIRENTNTSVKSNKFIDLKLDIDAPIILLPSDYHKNSQILCFNSGKIKCDSYATTVDSNLTNDTYPFNLEDLSIYIIYKWNDLKDQTALEKTFILQPVHISAVVVKPQENSKGFTDINVDIKSSPFMFILNSVNIASLEGIFTIINEQISKIPVPPQTQDFLVEKVTNLVLNKLSLIKVPKKIIKFYLEQFAIFITSTKKIAKIEMNKLSVSGLIDERRNSSFKFEILEMLIKDEREGSNQRDIFINPKISWLKQQTNLAPQVLMTYQKKIQRLTTDIGFVMQDMRVFLNFDLIMEIMKAFMMDLKSLKFLKRLKPSSTPKLSHVDDKKSFMRLSLFFQQIDLVVPTKYQDCNFSTSTSLNMTATVDSESFSKLYFSTKGAVIKTIPITKKNEMTLVISHLNSTLSAKSAIYSLLQPSRFMIESKVETDYKKNESVNKTIVRFESFVIFIGFSLLEYLKGLAMTMTQLRKQSQLQGKKEKQENNMKTTLYGSVDIDALQVFIINDREKDLQSLFAQKCSYTTLTLVKTEEEMKMIGDVIMTTEYFNPILTCWEPFAEDTKLSLELYSKPTEKVISLNFPSTFNVNITKGLLSNLVEVKKNLPFLAEVENVARPVKSKVKIMKSFEYVIQNHLDVGFSVWLSLENDPFNKYLEPGRYKNFSYDYVQKLTTLNNKRAKSTSIMNSIQSPTMFTFMFLTETENINADKPGFFLFSAEHDGKIIEFLVRIFSDVGKRFVSFEPLYKIANNTEYLISLNYQMVEVKCPPMTVVSVPFTWTLNVSQVLVRIESQSFYYGVDNEVQINPKTVVHQLCRYKIKKSYFYLFEVSYKHYFCNLLHSDVQIFTKDNQNAICEKLLNPGQETKIVVPSFSDVFISILESSQVFKTEVFTVQELENKILDIQNVPGYSIAVNTSEKLFSEYTFSSAGFEPSKLDLSDQEKEEKSKFYPQILTLFSDYLIINKTSHNLNIYDLVLPSYSRSFFSTDNKKIQLKLSETDSSWSEEFRIDTIGVSGALETFLSYPSPKLVTIGIKISSCPDPLKLTTMIHLSPRFLIWNYLEAPVFMRQAGHSSEQMKIPCISEACPEGVSFDYSFIDKFKSVELSANSSHWSGRFSLENLNDFQLKLEDPDFVPSKKSKRTPWYLSTTRFVQVSITSADESTIHVALTNPKDPDFRIFNYTRKEIRYCQAGVEEKELKLKPGSYCYFAWDDHTLNKKKLKVFYQDLQGKYSIEKLFFNKGAKGTDVNSVDTHEKTFKKLGDCFVYNEIKDSTREFYLKSPEYATDFEDVFNQRIKSYKSTDLNESKDSRDSKEISLVPQGSLFAFKITSKEIGISLFDQENRETFYISFKNFKLELGLENFTTSSRKEQKINVVFKVRHLQIDSCDPDPDLFPVILCPLSEFKESPQNSEKSNYLEFQVEMVNSFKVSRSGEMTPSIKIIQNFDLVLQKTQLKLNEETILKLVHLGNLFKILKSSTSSLQDSISPSYSKLETPASKASSQSKWYFRFIKLGVMQFTLTFQRSSKPSKSKESKKLFRVLKAVGGAFINISNSKLNFNEIIIINSFQTLSNFRSLLVKNYARQGMVQIYKIFGSIDIIGNPLSLIETLGTGVFQFMTEPAKGLLGGPKAFVVGLGKGVRSLVTSVIKGSFESASKITGGLYNVLKSATGETASVQPLDSGDIGKNAVTGLKEGANDIFQGIAGVVVKPFKGAKSRGAKGFASGLLSGTVGLIVSPFKLVLKLGNVITSTIASTASLVAEGKIHTFGRARFPRHWTSKVAIEAYNEGFAQAQAFLYSFEEFREEKILYFTECLLPVGPNVLENSQVFIIITLNWLIYVRNAKLKKKVQLFDLQRLEVHFFDGVFFLAVAGKSHQFLIPSLEFAGVACIFNRVSELGLKTIDGRVFYKCPKGIQVKDCLKD
jgi:hypothetical protein